MKLPRFLPHKDDFDAVLLTQVDNILCEQQLDLNLPYMKTPPAHQDKVLAQCGRTWRIFVLHFCAYASLKQMEEAVNHHNN